MVYVDPLTPCVTNSKWKWKRSSHLFADTEAELHDIARRIGLSMGWFQDHPDLPHYDLTGGKREAAVRLGAVEVSRRMMVTMMRERRAERLGGEDVH